MQFTAPEISSGMNKFARHLQHIEQAGLLLRQRTENACNCRVASLRSDERRAGSQW